MAKLLNRILDVLEAKLLWLPKILFSISGFLLVIYLSYNWLYRTLVSIYCNGESLDKIRNSAVTGQIGDSFGGTLGPVMGLLAAVFGGLAFWAQYRANEQQKESLAAQNVKDAKQTFQNHFFELVKLHRENVTELKYKKWYNGEMEINEGRKVFRVIYGEFVECYREVRRFSKFHDSSKIILPVYYDKLQALKRSNKLRVSIVEMVQIDIAFSIVYFGVGKESEPILLTHFSNKYYGSYFHRLIRYFQLKPKLQNKIPFLVWNSFFRKPIKEMESIFTEVYESRHNKKKRISKNRLVRNFDLEKYYGGHQHRLGHYFRHLYQGYKFLDSQKILNHEEKYFFGKTLRAQLSTYEQFVLFINSVSSLGLRWEYLPEDAKWNSSREAINFKLERHRLISKYNLIKNLPGKHFYNITFDKYYPNVNFEVNERF